MTYIHNTNHVILSPCKESKITGGNNMINLKVSEVISALYKNQIQMEEFKNQLGEAVLENYTNKKNNNEK